MSEMSEKLFLDICPETGICSIMRLEDSDKADLIAEDVDAVRAAQGNPAGIRAAIAEADAVFAALLSTDELTYIGKWLQNK